MGIQQDAGEILIFVYKRYLNNESVNANKLLETTKWDGRRIDRAVKYLRDICAIDIIFTMGNVNGVQTFIFKKMTPFGINIVENKSEFKKAFGFEVNLGLIKFSWNVSEK